MMRLFVCTLLDEGNQHFYGERMARLVEKHASLLRPIPPASAHITFSFLEDIPEVELVRLAGACGEATASLRSFQTTLGPPFVLYAGPEARLVCAPVVSDTKQLLHLETRLATALTTLYSADHVKRSKSFHVTLARFRKNLYRNAATAVDAELHEANPKAWTREQLIDHLEIVSSELRPGGPIYTTRHVIPLLGQG